MSSAGVPHYPRIVRTWHFLATYAARAFRLSPQHEVGSLATCPSCGDLTREHRGHVAGRCTMNDDLNALLAKDAAGALRRPAPHETEP